MARVDQRLETLLGALMENGFGWLSAEVINTIEAGRHDENEIDPDVSDPRAVHGDGFKEQSFEETSQRTPERFVPYDGDEQLEIALEVIIDRLSRSVKMLSESATELDKLGGSEAELRTTENDETSVEIDIAGAKEAMSELISRREALYEWLMRGGMDDEA